MSVCVSDSYLKERRVLTEGVLCLVMGIASSFVTTYILSAAGLLL